jgi:hypothetical protein
VFSVCRCALLLTVSLVWCPLLPADVVLCWQVESPKHPVGVVRSPLQPEEVRGLTRGGELRHLDRQCSMHQPGTVALLL